MPTAPTDRPQCPVAHLDLLDADTFADGVPHAAFREVRDAQPVFWFPQPGAHGGGFWVITRLADVQEVSRLPEVFSSAQRGALFSLGTSVEEDAGLELTRTLMLNMDAPEHGHLRNIVSRAFTPRVIRGLEARLAQITNEIVDRALARGEGDFVRDVSAELPLIAICELMGIPEQDRQLIFDWTNRLVGFDDPEMTSSPEDGELAMGEMYLYANELAEKRQAEPQSDIVTTLLQADVNGDKLSVEEFDMFFLMLCVAGNETTRNAISHGMRAFFEHPDQWELFTRERPLETAVDEILRWATPVIEFQRTATQDHVLGGQQVRAGERVVLYYPSANRDDSVIEDPDRFDITRTDNDHVAFGGGGPHFCLGAQLARAEIRLVFDTLADRVPGIAPTAPARTLRSMFLDGIKEMPVRYAPA
ncbi:MAG TPA: cytochrome P450 [Mycobacteriales bacterium]|nr:cytochrome P450 [Mycobacteriales bacterium]